MLPELLGAAAKYALPGIARIGTQFVAGKTAEQIGSKNENQSAQERLKARLLNEDPDVMGDRQARSSEASKNSQQGRSREDQVFTNQLKQSNNRADLQNQMMANDQSIAFQRGNKLADNYVTSARDQAESSAAILNSIMNSGQAKYGTI
jgi:hypothetical protein